MNEYIGITIGPIVETISSAKSTGQLWGSSYLFSYIMKTLTNKLIEDLNIKDKIVFPTVDSRLLSSKNEIGMFPDRLVFEGNSELFVNIEAAKEDIFMNIAKDIQSPKGDKDEFISYVFNYLNQAISINYGVVECEKENAISDAFNMLDCLELRPNFVNQYTEDLIQRYISNDNIKYSLLMKDAFEDDKNYLLNGKSFRSIEKICGKESELPRKYKNYFSIVVADGDNIGTINRNMKGDMDKLDTLSKDMIGFSLSMHEIVKRYNAITIYAGGDDLFILSPIGNDTNTVFDMITEIKEEYQKQVSYKVDDKYKIDDKNCKIKASISFGVAMYYFKYPLKEVINSAINQLFGIAKEVCGKDSLAVKLQKHSGQAHEFVFDTITQSQDSSYEEFINLINPKEKLSLKSFIYTLEKNKTFLFEVFENDSYRLDDVTDNLFDEPIHIGKNKEYIKRVLQLIKDEYLKNIKSIDGEKQKQIKEMAFYRAMSVVRIIKFMHDGDCDGGDGNE